MAAARHPSEPAGDGLPEAGPGVDPETGFDLRRHRNIQVSPGVPQPMHIYAATRVLMVPSVWEEPSGRVSAEAMLNGVPPIVSDRGGLPEAVGDGGIIEPLPSWLTDKTRIIAGPDHVRGWMDRVLEVMEDDEKRRAWSARARAAADQYLPENLAPRYVAFFESLERGPDTTAGPGLDRKQQP